MPSFRVLLFFSHGLCIDISVAASLPFSPLALAGAAYAFHEAYAACRRSPPCFRHDAFADIVITPPRALGRLWFTALLIMLIRRAWCRRWWAPFWCRAAIAWCRCLFICFDWCRDDMMPLLRHERHDVTKMPLMSRCRYAAYDAAAYAAASHLFSLLVWRHFCFSLSFFTACRYAYLSFVLFHIHWFHLFLTVCRYFIFYLALQSLSCLLCLCLLRFLSRCCLFSRFTPDDILVSI